MSNESEGALVAKAVSTMLNRNGREGTEDFIKAWSREHRTLQQGLTRLCMAWMKDLSEREHYDLRNEASVKLAKRVVALDEGLPFV